MVRSSKSASPTIAYALAALIGLSSCGTTPSQQSSSGPSGFSGQDIDDMKSAHPAKKVEPAGAILTKSTFDPEIAKSPGLVLVDFWASWCAPCKQVSKSLNELSVEFAGKLKFANYDLSEETKTKDPIATRFNIDSLPCLILLKDGKEIDRKEGLHPKDALKTWLQSKL